MHFPAFRQALCDEPEGNVGVHGSFQDQPLYVCVGSLYRPTLCAGLNKSVLIRVGSFQG